MHVHIVQGFRGPGGGEGAGGTGERGGRGEREGEREGEGGEKERQREHTVLCLSGLSILNNLCQTSFERREEEKKRRERKMLSEKR